MSVQNPNGKQRTISGKKYISGASTISHSHDHFFSQKFRGYCGVRYFEYQDDAYEIPESFAHHGAKRGHHGHRTQQHHKRTGHFEEQVRDILKS